MGLSFALLQPKGPHEETLETAFIPEANGYISAATWASSGPGQSREGQRGPGSTPLPGSSSPPPEGPWQSQEWKKEQWDRDDLGSSPALLPDGLGTWAGTLDLG